jgi:membrane protein DedA with SNARE-associated domain
MTAVIERFGTIGVFLLMVPESACVPVPSEVTLVFSGFAVHEGWMTFELAVLAATAGNVLGSLLAYGLGASRALDRVPGANRLLRRWEGLFDQHGLRAVFIARLLPLARTFVSLPTGARHVPLGPFVAPTPIGCALWSTVFVLVGVVAGSGWAAVSSVLGRVLLVAGCVMLAVTLARRAWRPGRGR